MHKALCALILISNGRASLSTRYIALHRVRKGLMHCGGFGNVVVDVSFTQQIIFRRMDFSFHMTFRSAHA